jgi:mRNA-degrading endonuclease toxin of MazEF toxin-antitoxin module
MAHPPCRSLGRHCHALDVTLRVAAIEGAEDHDATWMLGHTQRIDFGRLRASDDELWVDARLHVPCRYLQRGEDDRVSCRAHGFAGSIPAPTRPDQPRQLGRDRFRIVDRGRMTTRHLAPPVPSPPAAPRRALPVQPPANPCATAPCHTADGKRGAACCRDLQVEVHCPPEREVLEALLRTRKSPYLCKVDRENEEDCLTVEVLSACDYLLDDGIYCSLHGRERPDGRAAKPTLCSQWPEKRTGLHPGCAFTNRRIPL